MPYRASQDTQFIGQYGELTAQEELRVQEIQALADTDTDEALGKTAGSIVKKEVTSGSGDVVGPASSTDSNFAAFNGTDGKTIKDSGSKASDFAVALGEDDNYVTDLEKTRIGSYPDFPAVSQGEYLSDDGTFKQAFVGSGGFSGNVYLSETDSDVSGYNTLSYSPDAVETENTVVVNNNTVTAETFLYGSGVEATLIPSGAWRSVVYAKVSNSVADTTISLEVFLYHVDTTETTLFTMTSPTIEDTADYARFTFESSQIPYTTVETDRIGVRLKATTTRTTDTTVYYKVGGSSGAYFNTTLPYRHNQLRDLNEDAAFQHMTADEKTAIGTISGKANTSDKLSVFAATTSAELAGVISDETGSGLLMFNNSPTIVDDLTIGTAGTATGSLLLKGTTSGTVTVKVADAAGTYTLTLPTDDGGANQVLSTNGSGVLSWVDNGTGGTPTAITVANEASDTSCFPLFVTAATGDLGPKTNAGLAFNAATGVLTATGFSGPLTGNVTGNCSGSSGSCTGNSATVTGLSVTAGKTLSVSNSLTITATDGSTLAIGTGGTLGSAAYTASTAYATAAQGTTADNALPRSGGAITGATTITIADTTNTKALAIYQNDTTNKPLALQVGPDSAKVLGSVLVQFNDTNGNFSDWAFNVAGDGVPLLALQSTGGTLASPTASSLALKSTIATYAYNSAPGQKRISVMRTYLTDGTSTSEDAKMTFGVITAGTMNDNLELIGTSLYPTTTDGVSLGTSTNMFSDLFLASGAVINFNNGNFTATHSTGALAFSGTISASNLSGTNTGDQDLSGYVAKSLYDANTILYATTDNTPAALTVGEQTIVGRTTGGAIAALTIDSDLSSVSANDDTIPSAKATKAMGDLKLALAGGTMTGNITLGENTAIALDPAGSADEKWSGITCTGTAGATLAVGDLIYLDATATEWLLADADAASTSGDVPLGICILAAGDGEATNILLQGTIRSAAFPASIALGAPVYVSTTAGDITATQPSGTDDVIRRVGWAITAEPNTIYFNPENSYITHT